MQEGKKNIVWLASYPKSGNTWFRIFLSNLFSDSSHPVNINDLKESTISSNRNIIDSYLGIHTAELTIEEIDNLRPEVFKEFSDEIDDTAYVKTHEAWTLNSKGKSIFPHEITHGIIYLIRNPLDVVISYAYHNGISIENTISTLNSDITKLCERKDRIQVQTQQILNSWSNHVRSWTEESQLPVHVIRYEDMLDQPRETFRKAIEFLELEYEEDAVLTAIRNSSFDTLKAMEERDGFNERGVHSQVFFREGKSNVWEDKLSLFQINEIINHHRVIMKKFGYLN